MVPIGPAHKEALELVTGCWSQRWRDRNLQSSLQAVLDLLHDILFSLKEPGSLLKIVTPLVYLSITHYAVITQ